MKKRKAAKTLRLLGRPNPKQQLFFDSKARYTAYGGARGGGKSWALRRKLVMMALNYPGLRCLLIRRTYPELEGNHITALRSELDGIARYTDAKKRFHFPNGSQIQLGYCACDADAARYQGMEFDVIALDEATQLPEAHFNAFKACLRGANRRPKRMYLTCNPGGVGHAWVKRLFVDREFREGENPDDYLFIRAVVSDNTALTESCPEYADSLRSLPAGLRRAWLEGSWDVFDGQFFSEFSEEKHVVQPFPIPSHWRRFAALDYGFDMLAALWLAVDENGRCYVYRELCQPNLTLSEAAAAVSALCPPDESIEYAAASPDLWNRRQDTGYSGVEIMSRSDGLPPLVKADNRRVMGWLAVREYLAPAADSLPRLAIMSTCRELIRCLPALTFAPNTPGDAADTPHSVTHAPEALRYALMSRADPAEPQSLWKPFNNSMSLRLEDY